MEIHRSYVLSKQSHSSASSTIDFYAGDLRTLFDDVLRPKYHNIWVVGGAEVVKNVLQLDLADEIVVSKVPILLGDGLLFFDYIHKEQALYLKDVKAYNTGMVELHYEVVKK